MLYLIVSDLHGSTSGMKRLKEIVLAEKPDVLLMLGDMLHGAFDEDDFYCAKELKCLPCGLLGVRGNCDYSYDEKQLGITLPTARRIDFGLHSLYLMHRPPELSFCAGDVVLYGHTHRKRLEKVRGVYLFNPGSIALPRDDGPGYGLFNGKKLILKDALTQGLLAEEKI